MPSYTMALIEKLKPRLIEQAISMRKSGSSFDAVSRMLTAESGIEVGREMVRKFMSDHEVTK